MDLISLQPVLRARVRGHAERDVPRGAGHRQRPLLGALRLQAVRAVPGRGGPRPPGVQPEGVDDEQAGDVRPRALLPAQQRLQRRHQRQLPLHRALRLRQHILLRRARRGRRAPKQGGVGLGSARRARVRAGADGAVPHGGRVPGRAARARHQQDLRAQRARRQGPRRVRQLLHVLQRGRPRPDQPRRRRRTRPGGGALRSQQTAVGPLSLACCYVSTVRSSEELNCNGWLIVSLAARLTT
jgi:hypothetical protein